MGLVVVPAFEGTAIGRGGSKGGLRSLARLGGGAKYLVCHAGCHCAMVIDLPCINAEIKYGPEYSVKRFTCRGGGESGRNGCGVGGVG